MFVDQAQVSYLRSREVSIPQYWQRLLRSIQRGQDTRAVNEICAGPRL